ncbi:hypothetical protein C8R44DRAFT_372548 [Mycena epipterygia]|nr:hypothetical protein C8R44DRAFT_372548 [Mycena epipterygia]
MYGMIFFLTAFLFGCFWSTAVTTRVTVGFFWALISTLIVWCLLWQSAEDWTTVHWFVRVKSAVNWHSSSSASDSGDEEDIQNLKIESETFRGQLGEQDAGVQMSVITPDTEIKSSFTTAEMQV